jgi:hypothetical protein
VFKVCVGFRAIQIGKPAVKVYELGEQANVSQYEVISKLEALISG